MSALRNAHLLARLVLVWFALSIGVAVASPLVQPKAMALICAGAGVMTIVVTANDGSPTLAGALLDCPLCAHLGAPPPPQARVTMDTAQPLAYVLQSIPSAHIAAFTAAPLPARGPPHLL